MTGFRVPILHAFVFFWFSAFAFAQQHGDEATPAAPVHGDMHAPRIFTLRTGVAEGRMVFLGAGGGIDGQVNPTLKVHEGETVQINLVNGEGAEHDIVIDQYGSRSG